MVFTCWVGRPESAWGSGCVYTTSNHSGSERVFSQREQNNAGIYSWGFGACICSLFGLYSPSYLLSERHHSNCESTASAGGHCLDPVPVCWAPEPVSHSSLQPLLTLRRTKYLWLCGGFLPALMLWPGFHLPNGVWLGAGIFLSCSQSKTICCFGNNNQKSGWWGKKPTNKPTNLKKKSQNKTKTPKTSNQ